jgi:hypothetical protein
MKDLPQIDVGWLFSEYEYAYFVLFFVLYMSYLFLKGGYKLMLRITESLKEKISNYMNHLRELRALANDALRETEETLQVYRVLEQKAQELNNILD